MNKHLKRSIKIAFDAPESTRANEFINSINYPRTTPFQNIITQIMYISKSFWIGSSALILSLLFIFLSIEDIPIESKNNPYFLIPSLAPFLTLLGLLELNRSRAYKMDEIEASCKHNLGEVTLIRMMIFITVSIIIITFSAFIIAQTKYGFILSALMVLTPYLSVVSISLFINNHLKIRNTIYISASVTIAVIAFQIFLIYNLEIRRIFENTALLTVLTVTFAVFTIFEIRKSLTKMEVTTWNLE